VKERKILLEAGPMVSKNKSGVGYYVEGLLRSLATENHGDLNLSAYYFDFLGLNKPKTPDIKGLYFHKIKIIPGKIISVCRKIGFQPFLELFIFTKSDLVLFTNYVALPLLRRGTKTGLIVYDMSFFDTEEYVQEKNLYSLQRYAPKSILKADIIITISEFTRSRILHHFPELKAKIIVTPIPPIYSSRNKIPLPPNFKKLGIKKGKYILYIGTIEPRKNIESLIRAYAQLSKQEIDEFSLVLAGGKGWKDDGILQEIEQQQKNGLSIINTGYITDKYRDSLYQNACCVVLASHYEGFGMPIVEAMQYKIPIVVSDIAVFRETAGDAALYFNHNSIEDISEKISLILKDKGLRSTLVSNGIEQLKKYSWKSNADLVLSEIKNTLND
jgi:glycosyltransferase involved in cell wall biosynthesis